MTDPNDLTPEALQRANLRAMTDDQLLVEYAAFHKQAKRKQSDTYARYLTEEFKRRGRKVPA